MYKVEEILLLTNGVNFKKIIQIFPKNVLDWQDI